MLSTLAALLISALLLPSYALVTPLARDIAHRHHNIAARIPLAAPDAEVQPQRRRFRKRCMSRDHSSATVKAAPTTEAPAAVAPAPTSSKQPDPPKAPEPPKDPEPPKNPDPPKDDGDKGDAGNGGNTGGGSGGNTGGGGGGGGGGGPVMSGDGTFYDTGLGACGITNVNTDFIAAISIPDFDTYPGYAGGNPNLNPVCGKQITASYQGKSVTVIITDRCGGCKSGALDFSPAAFNQLADPSAGRIHGVTWTLPL